LKKLKWCLKFIPKIGSTLELYTEISYCSILYLFGGTLCPSLFGGISLGTVWSYLIFVFRIFHFLLRVWFHTPRYIIFPFIYYMGERQRIGVPWKCRPNRDVQRLLDVFLTLDSIKKKDEMCSDIKTLLSCFPNNLRTPLYTFFFCCTKHFWTCIFINFDILVNIQFILYIHFSVCIIILFLLMTKGGVR